MSLVYVPLSAYSKPAGELQWCSSEAQRLWSNKFLCTLWKQAIRWRQGTPLVLVQGGRILTHSLLDVSLVTEKLNFETQIWRILNGCSWAPYFYLKTLACLNIWGTDFCLPLWSPSLERLNKGGTAATKKIVLWNMPSLSKYWFPSLLLRNGNKLLAARKGYRKLSKVYSLIL